MGAAQGSHQFETMQEFLLQEFPHPLLLVQVLHPAVALGDYNYQLDHRQYELSLHTLWPLLPGHNRKLLNLMN